MAGIDDAVSICDETTNNIFQSDTNPNHRESSGPVEHLITALCLVNSASRDTRLTDALNESARWLILNWSDEDVSDYIKNNEVAYVLSEFEQTSLCPDSIYHELFLHKRRIYGTTVILDCIVNNSELPLRFSAAGRQPRPIYCKTMSGLVIYFTKAYYKSPFKHQINRLANLVHWMGGSIRKDLTKNVTHVVSPIVSGADYQLAVAMGTPVMSAGWLLSTWERRHDVDTSALNPELIKSHKLKPMTGLKLHFYGFQSHDVVDMENEAVKYGAKVVELSECDHLIIDVHLPVADAPKTTACPSNVPHVTAEWFWVTIQLDQCASEDLFLFGVDKPSLVDQARQCADMPLHGIQSSSAAGISRKNRVEPTERRGSTTSTTKRKSDNLSMSGNNLSFDASSDASWLQQQEHIFSHEEIDVSSPKKTISKRRQVCLELFSTEANYVDVLETILREFKEPLDAMSPEERQLDDVHMKHIFGSIPQIHAVHEEICRNLNYLLKHWQEDRLVGQVWLNQADKLKEMYPPFVNYFEKTKQMLIECRKNAKFNAFLKAKESKQACQRQTLDQLLIRPVQRLPSVVLLLTDILKRTEKSSPDHSQLESALIAIKLVLGHINDNKRQTDTRMHMFDIINGIDSCPPILLSAQRTLHCYVETVDRGRMNTSGKDMHKFGAPLSMYLFNDCLEIAKIRDHQSNTTSKVARKHVNLINLWHIIRIIDVTASTTSTVMEDDEEGECISQHSNTTGTCSLFCLSIRQEMDITYMFEFIPIPHTSVVSHSLSRASSRSQFYPSNSNNNTVTHGPGGDGYRPPPKNNSVMNPELFESSKKIFLQNLCKAVAHASNKPFHENTLFSQIPQDKLKSLLPSSPNYQNSSVMDMDMSSASTKSFRLGKGKLSRAFSIRGTPKSNTLSRAVSQMSLRSFGSTLSRMSRSNARLNVRLDDLPETPENMKPAKLQKSSDVRRMKTYESFCGSPGVFSDVPE